MANIVEVIHDIPCLRVIPQGKLHSALSCDQISIKRYGKNEIIHYDGDPCDQMEVIIEGEVAVERIDEEGHLMTVTDFSRGQSIGSNLVFSSTPFFPMTVSAKQPVTMACLKKEILSDLCASNEDFLKFFLQIISDHTLVLGNKIKYHVNSSIRAKIIAFLNRQYMEQKALTLDMKLSKTALAERMGIQRTSLSRELQKMRDEGLIDFNRRSISIRDSSVLNGP